MMIVFLPGNPKAQEDIYYSPEAFERYFSEVQRLRATVEVTRLREFREAAICKLEDELHQAITLEIGDLVDDLSMCIAQFRMLIDESSALTEPADEAREPDEPAGAASEPTPEGGPTPEPEPLVVDEPVDIAAHLAALRGSSAVGGLGLALMAALPDGAPTVDEELTTAAAAFPALRESAGTSAPEALIPDEPVRPQPAPRPEPPLTASPDEVSALLGRLAGFEGEWNIIRDRRNGSHEGEPSPVTSIKVRVLACSILQLWAEALEIGAEPAVRQEATLLLDGMYFWLETGGDRSDCPCFATEFHPNHEAELSAAKWLRLGELYQDLVDARLALDFVTSSMSTVPGAEIKDLVESISSRQQRLFRFLQSVKGSDWLQGRMYNQIREITSSRRIYLGTLEPSTHDETLAKHADALAARWASAEQRAKDEANRGQKADRRDRAAQAVVDLAKSRPDFGTQPRDKTALLIALQECLDCGVQPTRREIRDALIDIAPALLANEPAFSRFLDAVNEQRNKLGLDYVPPMPDADDEDDEGEEDEPGLEVHQSQVDIWREALEPFTKGRKIMILGGVRKTRVEDGLAAALGTRVVWHPTNPGTSPSRYEAEVKKSDILVVTAFAGHDLAEQARGWVAVDGKDFVMLSGGTGKTGVLRCLFEHFTRTRQ